MASSTLDRKEVRDHITMIAEWLTILRANDLLFQLRGYKKSAGQLSSAVPEDAGIFERKLTGIEKKFQQALEFQIDTGTGLKLNKRQAVNLGYKAARSASSAAPAIPMLGTALKLTIGTVQHVEKLLSDLSVYDIPDLIDNQKYPCTCGPDERKSDLTKCDAAIEWIHLRRFTNNAVTYGPASLGLALMVAFPPSSLVAAPAITAMTVSRGLYRKVKEELKKNMMDGRLI